MLGEGHAARFYFGEYLEFMGRVALQPPCDAPLEPVCVPRFAGRIGKEMLHELGCEAPVFGWGSARIHRTDHAVDEAIQHADLLREFIVGQREATMFPHHPEVGSERMSPFERIRCRGAEELQELARRDELYKLLVARGEG